MILSCNGEYSAQMRAPQCEEKNGKEGGIEEKMVIFGINYTPNSWNFP